MYAHFYHLSENPFNLTPDPKFHYINESTREALASIMYGIKSRKGFLTLIGEAGTGKTTLLRRIVDDIEGETRIVFVFNPGVSFDELLEFICMELGIRAEAAGRLKLLEKLNAYLLEQLSEGRNVVVIIDEAQTLDDAVLEELRLLSNLETSKEKILQIVLSGQPELEEKLRRPHLRQLRQRVGVRATLRPMRADEIRAYVETRLRSAGSEKAELFSSPALLRCWQASQGIPRVINVICDNAMMIAFAEGKNRISTALMNAAIRDLNGESETRARIRRLRELFGDRRLHAGAVAAGVLAVAFALGRGWPGAVAPDPVPRAQAGAGGATATEAQPAPPNGSQPSPLAAAEPPRVAAVGAATAATQPATATAAAAAQDPGVRPATPAGQDRLPPAAQAVVARTPPAADPPADSTSATAQPAAGLSPALSPAASTAAGTTQPQEQDVAAVPPPRFEDLDPLSDSEPPPSGLDRRGRFSEAVSGSVRQAQEMARSAAARLYGDPTAGGVDPTDRPVATASSTSAALAAASRSVPVRPSPAATARTVEPDTRSLEDAAALAEQAMLPPEEEPTLDRRPGAVSLPPEPLEPLAATSLGQPSGEPGLARGLESVASLSGTTGAAKPVRASGRPPIGRQVRVSRGDTVWALAMQYYGTVDSSVLTQIFRYNSGISDARHLSLGSDVFLPFLSPEQMVAPAEGGGYQLLLAESSDARTVDRAAAWASSALPGHGLRTLTRGKGTPVKTVYAVGFPSREAALESARYLLGRSSRSDAGSTPANGATRRPAG